MRNIDTAEEAAPHGYVRLDRLGRWHARRFQSRDSGLTFPTLERAKAWLARSRKEETP